MGRNVSHSPQLTKQSPLQASFQSSEAEPGGHGVGARAQEAVAPLPLDSPRASLTQLDAGHAAGLRAGHGLRALAACPPPAACSYLLICAGCRGEMLPQLPCPLT